MGKANLQYFADVPNKQILESIPHYRYELDVLEALGEQIGYELSVATNFNELSWSSDLYYGRWATTGLKSTIVSKFARAPSIIFTGGSEVVNNTKESTNGDSYSDRPLWHRAAIRFNLKACSKVVVPSDYSKNQVENICSNTVEVIPHFIDTDKYSPYNRQPLPSTKFEEYMLTISWLSDKHIIGKCLFKIVDAIERMDEKYKVVILGSDRGAYDRLMEYIRNSGVESQVEVVTEFSESEKISFLQNAKLYLQPTLHEGFGMANLEAMSTGTPVITSARGAVPEVVGDVARFVSPNDSNEIDRVVSELWNNREKLDFLSTSGRDRVVSKYSLDTGAETYRSLLIEYL